MQVSDELRNRACFIETETEQHIYLGTAFFVSVGRFATSDRTAGCPKTPERLAEFAGIRTPYWPGEMGIPRVGCDQVS